MNWAKFFGILLAPAILSAVLIGVGADFAAALGAVVALFGSIFGGTHCAGMLAQHLIERKAASAAMTAGFSLLFVSLSVGLCFMGCSVAFK